MSVCAHNKSLSFSCVDCLKEELVQTRRKVQDWKARAAQRSAERDEARVLVDEAVALLIATDAPITVTNFAKKRDWLDDPSIQPSKSPKGKKR